MVAVRMVIEMQVLTAMMTCLWVTGAFCDYGDPWDVLDALRESFFCPWLSVRVHWGLLRDLCSVSGRLFELS